VSGLQTASHRLLLPLVLASLAATGCTALDPRPAQRVSVTIPPAPRMVPDPPPPAPPVTVYVQTLDPLDVAARHLLAYNERLAGLSPAELAAEVARLGEGHASVRHAMELAVVLGLTRAPGDLQRALGVLDRVRRDASLDADAWHPLARLLAMRYAEQRRIEEQLDKATQQLRETQRDNQRRVEQLNEKLEALRAIERSLSARQPPAAGPPPAPPPAGKPAP
jgi:hypothetical protein